MQDTSTIQRSILDRTFENSTIQYFGDLNQTLYNNEEPWNPTDIKKLEISDSYRLSPCIAKYSKKVSVNPQENLNSKTICTVCKNCQNTIILFEDKAIVKVIPTFATLIEKQGLKGGDF